PALPEPPPDLVESAARAIPTILANVQPRHDGAIALVASNLVKRLQDARHTLAAAQWAIHDAIQAGRLLAGLGAVGSPAGVVLGPLGREWHGGEPGAVVIPKGKPAPFESFTVVATESLWAWWRSLDTAEPGDDEHRADGPEEQHEAAPAVTPTEPAAK